MRSVHRFINQLQWVSRLHSPSVTGGTAFTVCFLFLIKFGIKFYDHDLKCNLAAEEMDAKHRIIFRRQTRDDVQSGKMAVVILEESLRRHRHNVRVRQKVPRQTDTDICNPETEVNVSGPYKKF